jgi:hypothetical protein
MTYVLCSLSTLGDRGTPVSELLKIPKKWGTGPIIAEFPNYLFDWAFCGAGRLTMDERTATIVSTGRI